MTRIILMVTAALVLAALMAMSALPAFAQGQVERGPEHAKSICSFSGLNDEPDDPDEGGRVQSYGQLVRHGEIPPSEVKSGAPSPGTFCNPQKAPPFLVGPFPQE
jgi:hypothetical protein